MPGEETVVFPRPIAAGLLILLAGPPLGCCAVLAWFAAGFGAFSLGYVGLAAMDFLGSYVFGGTQSALSGFIVARHIRVYGWISLQYWLFLTACISLVSAIILDVFFYQNQRQGLLYISFYDELTYFAVATFFSSLFLRILIIGLGWMRRPC